MARWLFNVNAVRQWSQGANQNNQDPADIAWWKGWPQTGSREPYSIGEFIGQGRQMQYCGLSRALMKEIDKTRRESQGTHDCYVQSGKRLHESLRGAPPVSWYVIALLSLCIVWLALGMAILLAFNTPTKGLGCWSGSFLLYGALSTLTWVNQLFNPKGPKVKALCHVINVLALGWLVTVTFLMVRTSRLSQQASVLTADS